MRLRVISWVLLLMAVPGRSQHLLKGSAPGDPAPLFPSDAAVLEGRQSRTDLPCDVTPINPELGFDLAFHSGYEVTLRLRELSGVTSLVAVFRVAPESRPDQPVYFSQRWTVPQLDTQSKAVVQLEGGFMLGEGRYHVDWLMHDDSDRFCSRRWRLLADLQGKDRQVALAFPPATAAPVVTDLYENEARAKASGESPLRVLILVHVAPRRPDAAAMSTAESAVLLSILRNIAREPRIGTYSVVAFNLDQGEVIDRQRNTPQIDFPALGAAIRRMRFGTVTVQRLQATRNSARFLSRLVAEEMPERPPDAVIFIGPGTAADSPIPDPSLRELGAPSCPVFYLHYAIDTNAIDTTLNPWRDLIGSLVKLWRGVEYTIVKPRDLFLAWNQVMSRMQTSAGYLNSPIPKK